MKNEIEKQEDRDYDKEDEEHDQMPWKKTKHVPAVLLQGYDGCHG